MAIQRSAIATVAAALGTFLGLGGSVASAQISEAQVPLIRVHTDLVVLHAAVLDGKSRFVAGLPEGRFSVLENGVPQTIRLFSNEDRPAAIGLVLDNSGSMRDKRGDVVLAALAFARASNPLDEYFVVHFNENVWLGLPDGMPFANGPETLTKALAQARAFGRTALYDAIARGLEHLRQAQNPHRVLVVVSDGGDNASATEFEELLQRVQQTDVVIYTIGLFDEYARDRNPRVLKELAAVTGGEAFLPGGIDGAAAVLQRIARDIRSIYLIGYESSNTARDGKFRQVRVTLQTPRGERLKIRTRPGYFAPSD
ncbi:MAG: VWA domain-containing protein [Acidobacteria bacterium]|nr:VWA domain-containing protein [Acidobacteriota bacterium]